MFTGDNKECLYLITNCIPEKMYVSRLEVKVWYHNTQIKWDSGGGSYWDTFAMEALKSGQTPPKGWLPHAPVSLVDHPTICRHD